MLGSSRPACAAPIALLMLAAGAAFAPARAGAEPAPLQMGLEEAVERGLRHSPTIAQALGAVRQAELARRTALGAYLPSVTVNAATTVASARRFNPQTNTTDEGSAGSHNAGVSAA
ncbi:MAG: TolC family protein, partial [Myxococcales bacterium]